MITLALYVPGDDVDRPRYADGYHGADDAHEQFEFILGILTERPRAVPWATYLAVLDDNRIAGLCSLKTEPDELGWVEISYGTLPAHQGQGVAKAMAAGLVAIAEDNGARAFAHTRPEENASTRVLLANGFIRVSEIIDPEDGLVWRWERGRKAGRDVYA